MNVVAVAAAADDDDNNLNATLQFEYENSIVDLDGIQRDLSHVKRSNDDDKYWQDDEESNSFIIEEECSIGFVPNQHDSLFAFPNGKDVLDDSLFTKYNSINNDEADVVLEMENRLVHSESIECNPSKIPNDEERVVLLSLVSRVVKDDVVKNNEDHQIVKNNKVMRYNNLSILQIVLSISLQLECEWILKKYQVDNDSKMEWTLKNYRVDNDSKIDWFFSSGIKLIMTVKLRLMSRVKDQKQPFK